MTESPAVPAAVATVASPRAPRRVTTWLRAHEGGFWRWGTLVAAVTPLVALVFTLVVLAVKAWPAAKVNGFGFFTHTTWNPSTGGYGGVTTTNGVEHPIGASFGALSLIVGTLQTSGIALIVAVPVSIGAAFAITQGRLPRVVARALGFAVEVLAGFPSVVIGLWGVFTLGPFLAQHVYPAIANHMPDVPVLRYFRPPTGHGEGLMTAGLVLALMIIPIVAATTRDLFLQVPPLPKEGGEALGMTDWEVGRRITLPWVRTGIVGASALGLGRALGETIAVAMISGSVTAIAPNAYSPMTTIAATIVTQLDGAGTDATGFWTSTLAEIGLVLAVISVVVNLLARAIVRRTSKHAAPVGRAL